MPADVIILDNPRPVDGTPPGKVPGYPDVSKVRSRSVELHWDPPLYTGGSPITGYSVSSRQGGEGDFVEVHTTPDAICLTKVTVPPDTWLEFTVSAINGTGTGPSSRPSMPVLSHPRRRKGRKREGERSGKSSGAASRSRRRKDGGARSSSRHRQHDAGVTDSEGDDDDGDADWQAELAADLEANAAPRAQVRGQVQAQVQAVDKRTHSFAARASASDVQRYEVLRAELQRLEDDMRATLGRQPENAELAASATYRSLAVEYAELRKMRDAAESVIEAEVAANREWQQTLQALGFDINARLEGACSSRPPLKPGAALSSLILLLDLLHSIHDLLHTRPTAYTTYCIHDLLHTRPTALHSIRHLLHSVHQLL